MYFTGKNYYIKVKFNLQEVAPYIIDCFIDSSCQSNFLRKNVIPSFYWKTMENMAISINSEVVHLFGEAENLPLEINGYKFELSLQGLK